MKLFILSLVLVSGSANAQMINQIFQNPVNPQPSQPQAWNYYHMEDPMPAHKVELPKHLVCKSLGNGYSQCDYE